MEGFTFDLMEQYDAEERHGDAIEQRGILYAPDYVANAGGALHGAEIMSTIALPGATLCTTTSWHQS